MRKTTATGKSKKATATKKTATTKKATATKKTATTKKATATATNPIVEMMAGQMAMGAISSAVGGNDAIAPMVAQLSKMDARQMQDAIKTLTPLVGMLSQMTK